MGAGALWAVSLREMMARQAVDQSIAAVSPYGPVGPRIDQTTGLPLLQLPEGFSYFSYGWNGDRMSDGIRTPPLHDGMAVVDLYNGNPDLLVLVRNHEVDGLTTPYINKPEITYATNGGGGTTNLIFDARRGRFVKSWASLAGTIRNCAGGVTPWGSWITCEETTTGNAAGTHGWCYDVGATAGNPTALTAMGRFNHEAMMVDPATGYVYETEDNGASSGFYRFVPNVAGQLADGGDLYMLKVKNTTQLHLGSAAVVGTIWDVEWVRIPDPLALSQSIYAQGRTLGATGFNRLEGAWWSATTGYFLSTSGGSTQNGQVFEYNPGAGTLTLIYNSPDFNDCDNPDNMTITPRGGLLLCEDAAGGVGGDVVAERLIGLTLTGTAFTFAVNNINLPLAYNDRVSAGNYRTQEWAGACYSPDGKWLFVNIQTPGVTFAITGPWGLGPL
jgi:secreted PhoX family phosphatase